MSDHLTIPLTQEQVQDLLDSALPTEQEHIRSHALPLARQLIATMQREQERQWQPIDTAPKDGRLVFLYKPSNGKIQSKDIIAVCKWMGGCWRKDGSGLLWTHNEVTHWMPLPEPPVNHDPRND